MVRDANEDRFLQYRGIVCILDGDVLCLYVRSIRNKKEVSANGYLCCIIFQVINCKQPVWLDELKNVTVTREY